MSNLSQKKQNSLRKINIWYIVFSVLFSAMLIISRHIFYTNEGVSTVDSTYVTEFHIVDFIALIPISMLVYILIQALVFLIKSVSNIFYTQKRKPSVLLFLGMVSVIFLLWIPYLMSYWPGGIYSDTVDTLDMALMKKPMTNHNPVLYTLLWRFIFRITGAFSGNGEYAGLKLFTVLQALLLALSLATFVYYCYRTGVQKKVVVFMLLFFAVFPLYPFYGVAMWKDTLFCIVLFLLCLFLYDSFVNSNGTFGILRIIIYSVLCLLTVFLRNNGIFIIIFSSVLTTLICIRKFPRTALKIGLSSAAVITVSLLIQIPFYNSRGYNDDSTVESLGIPLQQTAYILSTDGEIDPQDYEVFNEIMPMENWHALYSPIVVDPIKFDPSFNRDYFMENSNLFMQSYMRTIRKNPVKAFKSYLLATMGFWDVYENSPVAYICNFHFSNANYFMSDYFDYYFDISFRNFAEPKTFLSSAIFVWIMVASIFICLAKRNYTGLIPLLPSLGLWLTIMVATPVAFSFRYIYSLFLCTPIYFLVLLSVCNENKNPEQ